MTNKIFTARLRKLCASNGTQLADQLHAAMLAKTGRALGCYRIAALLDGAAPSFDCLRELAIHFDVDMEYIAGKSDVRSTKFGKAAADAEDVDANKFIEDMLRVCAAVHAKHSKAKKTDHSREHFDQGRPRKDVSDQMPCPICITGTLAYSVSGYNGHIHARCSTPNCVAFIQ